MAPDYNDGLWHGWNGGECPVHPKTQVRALEQIGVNWNAAAEDCDWNSFKGAFRVVKEYREPRELWHVLDENGEVADTFTDRTKAHDRTNECSLYRLVHYREVMDGEAQ